MNERKCLCTFCCPSEPKGMLRIKEFYDLFYIACKITGKKRVKYLSCIVSQKLGYSSPLPFCTQVFGKEGLNELNLFRTDFSTKPPDSVNEEYQKVSFHVGNKLPHFRK